MTPTCHECEVELSPMRHAPYWWCVNCDGSPEKALEHFDEECLERENELFERRARGEW